MPLRNFPELQRELEDVVSCLKHTRDPKERVRLLRELRALIEEADSIIESGL